VLLAPLELLALVPLAPWLELVPEPALELDPALEVAAPAVALPPELPAVEVASFEPVELQPTTRSDIPSIVRHGIPGPPAGEAHTL
jgi:hypothetical protein